MAYIYLFIFVGAVGVWLVLARRSKPRGDKSDAQLLANRIAEEGNIVLKIETRGYGSRAIYVIRYRDTDGNLHVEEWGYYGSFKLSGRIIRNHNPAAQTIDPQKSADNAPRTALQLERERRRKMDEVLRDVPELLARFERKEPVSFPAEGTIVDIVLLTEMYRKNPNAVSNHYQRKQIIVEGTVHEMRPGNVDGKQVMLVRFSENGTAVQCYFNEGEIEQLNSVRVGSLIRVGCKFAGLYPDIKNPADIYLLNCKLENPPVC